MLTIILVVVLLALSLGSGCQQESPPPEGQVMMRQMEHVDVVPDTIQPAGMRDQLLMALLMGYAVQQRCGVTPPLTRSLEVSSWLTQKYAGVEVLMKSMLVDLENTAEAYCKNNG